MDNEVSTNNQATTPSRADILKHINEAYSNIPSLDDFDNQSTETRLDAFFDNIHSYFTAEAYAPNNTPELARTRILKAFEEGLSKRFPHRELPEITSLSKAVDLYGLNQKFLHTLSISDEMALLGATYYAGASRHTKSGKRLSKQAESILKNENTNGLVQNGQVVIDINKENEEKLLDALHRSWLSSHTLSVIDHIDALDLTDEAPIVSIDEVFRILAKQRYIGEESSLENELRNAANIEEIDFYDELNQPIRNIPKEDLSHRLTDISIIEHTLYEKFGADITIQYKELAPSLDKTTRDAYEQLKHRTPQPKYENQAEPIEGSSDFSRYTFIEITKADGEVYVIADSPEQSNACYIVRSDIVQEMSILLGKTLTWGDVLKYPKETARQLGAVRFYHTSKDTLEKAFSSIDRSPIALLKTIAEKWLTAERSIYTAEMRPTLHNRLPRDIRTMVAERPNEVKQLLLDWLGQERVSNAETAKNIGGKAVEDTFRLPTNILAELEHARFEIAQKDAQIKQLKDDKAKLWAMLKIAINDKSNEE